MRETKFKPGDRVEKFTGDYSWDGIVAGIATLPDENGVIWDDGETRYLVAHKAPRGWVLHVYAERNLREAPVEIRNNHMDPAEFADRINWGN